MPDVTNELIYEVLKKLQGDIGGLKMMRSEMRDGFASVRQYLTAIQSDYQLLERRMSSIEADVDRVMRRLEISDGSE
ncbi:MAG: hypothetical protein R3D66_02520 [Alphaproteobacteria bacterium]|nr:hypothetical protein [Alphaproteobacteria bacterium]